MRLSKHRMFYGRILNITNDSLQVSSITYYNYFKEETAYKPHWINVNEIEKLIIPDPDKHNFETIINLKKYTYQVVKEPVDRTFEVKSETSYASLVKDGFNYGKYFHKNPKFLNSRDSIYDKDREEVLQKKSIYRWRNGAWFSPLHADKINGLATGIFTGIDKVNYTDSLSHQIINGVNVNPDIFTVFIVGAAVGYSVFGSIDYVLHKKYRDSLNKAHAPYDSIEKIQANTFDTLPPTIKINGLSVSTGVFVTNPDVNGVFINALISNGHNIKGLSITGLGTKTNSFKGVQIAGIYNKTIKAHGLQIGIFNKCKELKGIQMGIWNVNAKRQFPFINWGF